MTAPRNLGDGDQARPLALVPRVVELLSDRREDL